MEQPNQPLQQLPPDQELTRAEKRALVKAMTVINVSNKQGGSLTIKGFPIFQDLMRRKRVAMEKFMMLPENSQMVQLVRIMLQQLEKDVTSHKVQHLESYWKLLWRKICLTFSNLWRRIHLKKN